MLNFDTDYRYVLINGCDGTILASDDLRRMYHAYCSSVREARFYNERGLITLWDTAEREPIEIDSL